MAVEKKRGCGYRKVGGLYMVSGQLSAPCGRLPLELHVCPTCNQGVKQSRAWTWIKPRQLLANAEPCKVGLKWSADCRGCPLSPENLPELAGLLWIGEKFYKTAEEFMDEARRLGVSRRIPAIPRNFKLGESWVLMAHPKAITREARTPEEIEEAREQMHPERVAQAEAGKHAWLVVRPGVVTMFRPTALEKLVTETQAKDAAAMEELAKKHITPVVVPDNDPDHQGSVHDDN